MSSRSVSLKNGDTDKRQWGERFRDWLVEEFGSGGLNAKQVCIIAYMATYSGSMGVSDLGYDPNAASCGHFNDHLRLVLNLNEIEDRFYWAKAATVSKHTAKRELTWIPIIPPAPELCERFCEEDWDKYRSDDWTPNFANHPVRDVAGRDNWKMIIPYSIYLDATPFTAESFYGLFVTNLITGFSQLCCIMLKSEFCNCGCRGQCTLFEIHDVLQHFLAAWAQGIHITERHDGRDWLESDSKRRELAGTATLFFGACCELKGDYPELCYTCGFKGIGFRE